MNAADAKKAKELRLKIEAGQAATQGKSEAELEMENARRDLFKLEYAELHQANQKAVDFNAFASRFYQGQLGGQIEVKVSGQSRDGEKETYTFNLSNPENGGNLPDAQVTQREQFLRFLYAAVQQRANDDLNQYIQTENSLYQQLRGELVS